MVLKGKKQRECKNDVHYYSIWNEWGKNTLLRKRNKKNNKPAHNNKTSEFDVFMVHRILKSCYTIAIASQLINDLQITDGWIVMLHRQILFYFPFFPFAIRNWVSEWVSEPHERAHIHTHVSALEHVSSMYKAHTWWEQQVHIWP